VDVTLDPDTAHPHLLLSQDGKGVRWDPQARPPIPDHPKRFDSSRCVLGLQALLGGRCYWEVEVVTGTAWAVGLAKESVKRKGKVKMNPREGIWALGRCGGHWQALTCPPVPLVLPWGDPKVVGVELDRGGGRVAFWDVGKMAAIFSFPPAAFGGEGLLPLLCL
ncbi:Butyrophilin subfamily 1 member A1, partial [Chaetura pelagica]